MTTWRWTTLLVLSMWTATCGQKGPLQLPDPQTSTPNGQTTMLTTILTSVREPAGLPKTQP
ncbi:MAG: lipoprotein [bacterium]